MSRPVWGAWIEINTKGSINMKRKESRPVWGAWIEILHCHTRLTCQLAVAPRMGRVD